MVRASLLLVMTLAAASVSPLAWAEEPYGSPPSYPSARPEPTPMLTWPGKPATAPVERADNRFAPTQLLATTSIYHQSQPPQAAPTSLYDPPPPRWRSADAAPAQPQPQPAPQPPPQAANGGQGPHFYSVARQYGVQPDPVQLSPQFLASTPQADMAEPPPLPPPHTAGPQSANMSAAAATNQVRQAQEAAADADAAALGN